MSDHLKWKAGLLSSNMPLELEAARLLSSQGFAVHSDYKYVYQASDMSVDLHAKSHVPFFDSNLGQGFQPDQVSAKVELLVECKHRHSSIAWLFLPDANTLGTSPARLGNTIRMVDKFSSYVIESDAAEEFDSGMPVCQKGLEIDMERGDFDELAFHQGLSHLQYALPHILTENILSYIEAHPEENIPFLFCPILLTSSKLFVLNKDTTTTDIEDCSKIEDIASQYPYVMMYVDYPPAFKTQCANEVDRLKYLQKSDRALIIERKRAGYYGSQFNLPFTIINSLITSDRYYLDTFFTQFIICSNQHFSELIERIKMTVESALKTRQFIE